MRLVVGIAQIAIAVWLLIQSVHSFAAFMGIAPLDEWPTQMWTTQLISFSIPLVMLLGGWFLIRDFGLLADKFEKPNQLGDPQ